MTDQTDVEPDRDSMDEEPATPGSGMKDPTETDHPTGVEQARENVENESPS